MKMEAMMGMPMQCQHVRAEERVGVPRWSRPGRPETHIVVRSNEGRSEGAFIAEARGGARHVGGRPSQPQKPS